MTVRLPTDALRQRLALYGEGLSESGLSDARQAELRRQAAVWRFVYIAESQAQAEDELSAALLEGRHHMKHARTTLNPSDFKVDETLLNPWANTAVPDDEALRFVMANGTICGTPEHAAEQLAELREINVDHVLCQMSFGYISNERIKNSMRLFAKHVMPTAQSRAAAHA